MSDDLRVVAICDEQGHIVADEWLRRAEGVHRQLRDRLPADYAARMAQVFAGGARMSVLAEDDAVVGVAVWRIVENTYEGRRCYVDDLVTEAGRRSQGLGAHLLGAIEAEARARGCDVLALDSGTQRMQAHRFYFMYGMTIPAFCFRKTLS